MILIRDLCVCFGEHTVFDHFSCDIPLDGNTVLRGASGAGKTTLLRVLAGLYKPDAGTVRGAEALRISLVFQEDRLLPWYTALDNVALVSDRTNAERMLLQLGLEGFLHEKPAALSGGMKRRVAIARALAYGGDLLLLDEPFTGLDETAKASAAEALRLAGVPLIAALHNDGEAALLHPKTIVKI